MLNAVIGKMLTQAGDQRPPLQPYSKGLTLMTTGTLNNTTSIDHPVTHFHNEHEASVAYNRSDEIHIEFVLSTRQQVLTIITFPLLENPNMEPETQIVLGAQEARLLRDLLNRREVQLCLDAE